MAVPVIAIDGPSASGKGTIAKRVAEALGFDYLESGALYRLVGLIALRRDLEDQADLAQAAETMDVVFLGDEILLEDQDVSQHIRHEAVGNRASEVARMPAVRQALLKRQRAFRRAPGLVSRWPRHGNRGVPRRGAQNLLDSAPGSEGRAAL